MTKKLSDIMKEMAEAILVDPAGDFSDEAAHAALLLAHIAWNRSVSASQATVDCHAVLHELEASNPALWSELRDDDPERLVAEMVRYKEGHYPHDRRWIVVCGTVPGGNVHVQWLAEAPR